MVGAGGTGRRQGYAGLPTARAGASYAQEDAGRLLGDALLLHGEGRFRGAIVRAILSVEESLKGIELGAWPVNAVALGDWARLRSHSHKFVDIPAQMMRRAEADCAQGTGRRATDRERIADGARRSRTLVRNLQRVKEMCAYEGWDANAGKWEEWDTGSGEMEALALFVLELARVHLEVCRAGTLDALKTLGYGDDVARHDPGMLRRGEDALRRLSDQIDRHATVRGQG